MTDYIVDRDWCGAPLSDLRKGLADRLERRKLYRRTYRELASLGDRELDDIGVSRANIRRIARESAYIL